MRALVIPGAQPSPLPTVITHTQLAQVPVGEGTTWVFKTMMQISFSSVFWLSAYAHRCVWGAGGGEGGEGKALWCAKADCRPRSKSTAQRAPTAPPTHPLT